MPISPMNSILHRRYTAPPCVQNAIYMFLRSVKNEKVYSRKLQKYM